MLSWALERAGRLAPEERIVAVVADQHREWWEEELASFPALQVVVQPRNRGTAPGILLPLVCVAHGDPEAVVAVLPSDHYVESEDALAQAVTRAARCASEAPGKVVLLGVQPDRPETDYGWILPGPRQARGAHGVAAFVEKPDEPRASRLMAQGGLWNSFLFVAKARTVLDLFGRTQPRLLWRFLSAMARGGARLHDLDRLYERLPVADFSRDVLQRAASRLAVLPVAPCGWTDLGTPARVRRWRMRGAEAETPDDAALVPAGTAWGLPGGGWAPAR